MGCGGLRVRRVVSLSEQRMGRLHKSSCVPMPLTAPPIHHHPLTPGDLSSLKDMKDLTTLNLAGCKLITGTVAGGAHGRVDGGS